jgi:hypothetical protein
MAHSDDVRGGELPLPMLVHAEHVQWQLERSHLVLDNAPDDLLT